MKKFVLPLIVVALVTINLFSSFSTVMPNASNGKQLLVKRSTVDIGTFMNGGIYYEAYGPSGTTTVSYVIDQNGNQITAFGAYHNPGGPGETITVHYIPFGTTTTVIYSGPYSS